MGAVSASLVKLVAVVGLVLAVGACVEPDQRDPRRLPAASTEYSLEEAADAFGLEIPPTARSVKYGYFGPLSPALVMRVTTECAAAKKFVAQTDTPVERGSEVPSQVGGEMSRYEWDISGEIVWVGGSPGPADTWYSFLVERLESGACTAYLSGIRM